MPVIAADPDNGGLVGKVTNVDRRRRQVTLITDHTISVSARVVADRPTTSRRATSTPRPTGSCRPRSGDPNDLVLQYTTRNDDIRPGDVVVTAGICSARLTGALPARPADRHASRASRTPAPTTRRSTSGRSSTCAAPVRAGAHASSVNANKPTGCRR